MCNSLFPSPLFLVIIMVIIGREPTGRELSCMHKQQQQTMCWGREKFEILLLEKANRLITAVAASLEKEMEPENQKKSYSRNRERERAIYHVIISRMNKRESACTYTHLESRRTSTHLFFYTVCVSLYIEHCNTDKQCWNACCWCVRAS